MQQAEKSYLTYNNKFRTEVVYNRMHTFIRVDP